MSHLLMIRQARWLHVFLHLWTSVTHVSMTFMLAMASEIGTGDIRIIDEGLGKQPRLDGVLILGRESQRLRCRVGGRVSSRGDEDAGFPVVRNVEWNFDLDPSATTARAMHFTSVV